MHLLQLNLAMVGRPKLYMKQSQLKDFDQHRTVEHTKLLFQNPVTCKYCQSWGYIDMTAAKYPAAGVWAVSMFIMDAAGLGYLTSALGELCPLPGGLQKDVMCLWLLAMQMLRCELIS